MAITVNDKDLGMVTAYAYALAGGYTGTEEEFEALLGKIAEDLAEIENLSVQVQTLPAGSDATASYAEGVLTLGIPRGDKGETGDQGEIGPTPQLSVGAVTTGEPGTDAEVEITGTPEAPVLNFTLPRGDTGNITQAVRYDAAQTLTDAEKEQARANIDAADAGEVADLRSAIDELGDSVFAKTGEAITITRSRFIAKSTGINTSNSKYARTGLLDGNKSFVAVGMSNPIYRFFVSYYYENGNISDGTGYIKSSKTVVGGSELIYILSDAKKIAVSFSRVDEAVLTNDDTTAIQAALSLYTLTDKTLTILGAPADAKVVGERLTVLESGEKTYTLTPGFTDGVYVYKDNTLVTNSTYSVSDYVDVKPYSKIKMNWYLPSDSAYMVFLDESREIVVAAYNRSTTPAYTSGENIIPIPEGAAWFRTSQRTDHLSSFSLSGTFPYIEKTKELLSATEPVEELPCSTIIKDGGFCKIFKTIGVVGDSLSSGSMHPHESGPSTGGEDEVVVDKIWYSWIQQMARYTGSTAINFSEGGLGARSLRFSTAAGATQIRSNLQNPDNMCNAYFIAMGHNDKTYMNNHPEYTIGTNADIDTTNKDNNPDTYCGDIGWIISTIKEVVPKAKIFIITMKVKSTFGALNDALRTIPEVFNTDENRTVYLLDMEMYAPKLDSSWEYLNGHGSPQGYLNYSWQISSYVDWYIRHYQNEFKLTAFFQ